MPLKGDFLFSVSLDLLSLKTSIMAASVTISKKRKFVADGVFYAELNELLTRELAEGGSDTASRKRATSGSCLSSG